MKIKEILKEEADQKMPHVYLDMDGVQADFFGAWSKKSGVDHWKSIGDKEAEIDQLANSSKDEVYNFFRDLEPLTGGMQVINWLKQNNIPYTVLSAPLRGPYKKDSERAKNDWLDEYHSGNYGRQFTDQKYIYATHGGQPNVLVDDFGKYLNAWKNAGGIAVKHEDQYEDPDTGSHTIEKLEKIFAPYLNK